MLNRFYHQQTGRLSVSRPDYNPTSGFHRIAGRSTGDRSSQAIQVSPITRDHEGGLDACAASLADCRALFADAAASLAADPALSAVLGVAAASCAALAKPSAASADAAAVLSAHAAALSACSCHAPSETPAKMPEATSIVSLRFVIFPDDARCIAATLLSDMNGADRTQKAERLQEPKYHTDHDDSIENAFYSSVHWYIIVDEPK
jgi:hypothetical protein